MSSMDLRRVPPFRTTWLTAPIITPRAPLRWVSNRGSEEDPHDTDDRGTTQRKGPPTVRKRVVLPAKHAAASCACILAALRSTCTPKTGARCACALLPTHAASSACRRLVASRQRHLVRDPACLWPPPHLATPDSLLAAPGYPRRQRCAMTSFQFYTGHKTDRSMGVGELSS
jgi:hypothetical protein